MRGCFTDWINGDWMTLDDLSPRQREIVDKIVEGFGYKDIARQLGMAHETVRVHVTRIAGRIPLRPDLTRREAVRVWAQSKSQRPAA